MRFSSNREEPGPSHWIIIDPRPPGYIGQEVVDLSPGAIELRHAAHQLREYAERREHWIDLRELERDWSRWPGDRPDHVRDLSFGVRVMYGIDIDEETGLFQGQPVRHLAVHGSKRPPTPATVGEIASYFWGRRAAQMRIASTGRAHVVVGMNWEQLDPKQLMRLL
ncbi:MAG: hypothetical protein GWN99_07595 [Gemmatimonadetes bacterium]|uniref:Uncharacterized protein n=1 Tax=Candidatus Kutchimonas denitrificans TaxID=3056748 RepID=A0AAE5C943_9BACT|nr:hypothetical protein [Gemmatimonadota bacterium]NIR75091.1 hypothetical protein [Candidatus Kutchimonas denitrificans]NIS00923.1 hypothetical protein [Gemmatimonadota bacterium]NIT66540.1 hypothetical protein [Gemmatimonadota bacterium]NIU52886.1 hypothetical protein [Gemmatimonadota bacterium]